MSFLEKKIIQQLKIENATVKYRDQVLFSGLNLEINENEHWAVVGEGGSGKSALLKALVGRYVISHGKISHLWYETYKQEHTITDPLFSRSRLMAYVDVRHDFKNLSNTRDFFYQQRFNAGYSDNTPTVRDFLREKAAEHFFPEHLKTQWTTKWTIDRVVETFHLESLLTTHLIKLSNGETKRLRMAAALLKNPKILLLDNPLNGLDVATREGFEDIFADITASGTTIIMATRPREIPEIITHVAVLHRDRQLTAMPRHRFVPERIDVASHPLPDPVGLQKVMRHKDRAHYDVLVGMKNVRVAYGETVIFENINWEIRPGDCWALSGPNGSGKSTLLALINGDHPQAYANDIVLFDVKRGSGESIWDIKRKIGFMSPELFQYFPYHFTGVQVVESGFYDTIGLIGHSRPDNREIAERWMDVMGLSEVRDVRLADMPATRQRLCLLARAMVKNPHLLLLDEPCLGFDRHQQERFKHLVDAMAKIADFGLVYVTHHQESLPKCINKTLSLGHLQMTP